MFARSVPLKINMCSLTNLLQWYRYCTFKVACTVCVVSILVPFIVFNLDILYFFKKFRGVYKGSLEGSHPDTCLALTILSSVSRDTINRYFGALEPFFAHSVMSDPNECNMFKSPLEPEL